MDLQRTIPVVPLSRFWVASQPLHLESFYEVQCGGDKNESYYLLLSKCRSLFLRCSFLQSYKIDKTSMLCKITSANDMSAHDHMRQDHTL